MALVTCSAIEDCHHTASSYIVGEHVVTSGAMEMEV